MADPESTSFASSNLSAGTFDAESGEMRITFGRGKSYLWTGVTPEQWLGLKSAFSPGSYLRDNFPDGEPE